MITLCKGKFPVRENPMLLCRLFHTKDEICSITKGVFLSCRSIDLLTAGYPCSPGASNI